MLLGGQDLVSLINDSDGLKNLPSSKKSLNNTQHLSFRHLHNFSIYSLVKLSILDILNNDSDTAHRGKKGPKVNEISFLSSNEGF